jgi:hypothetical protein
MAVAVTGWLWLWMGGSGSGWVAVDGWQWQWLGGSGWVAVAVDFFLNIYIYIYWKKKNFYICLPLFKTYFYAYLGLFYYNISYFCLF